MSMKGTASCRGAVVRSGNLKKLKTSGKKWFVLRGETCESSACLEYYDSEKKFIAGHPPKRRIHLKTCFNINKRSDTKHKHVIALYTKDDCFCVVLENEEDLDTWLRDLLKLQRGNEVAEGEAPKPTFEHVWQVKVLSRGLGETTLLCGRHPDECVYRLCLTDKTLSLIRKDCEETQELALTSIRSCGSLKNYFYLETGRSSPIGAGELWMDAEDANIAQNIHQTVLHAMTSSSSSNKITDGEYRKRASSATETSNTTSNQNRRPLQASNMKPLPFHQGVNANGPRERCDSMPSRPRTTSEGNHLVPPWGVRHHTLVFRPQSLFVRDVSHSPPSESPMSPPSASTDSAGSSLSIDDSEPWPENESMIGRYSNSLTPDEAIAEDDEHVDSPLQNGCHVLMAPISSDDGYVDMSPGGRHMHNSMSPAASTSSVTSGTPSTDLRFAEYHLEKVSSYFTPNEDYENTDRPIRANSVGSRPDIYKYNTRIEMSTTPENARVRAFSVGSRSKKVYNRVLPPHGHAHTGAKSSSAPILSNSKSQGSHGSIGPMGDLMELDFSSKPSSQSSSGYMDMRPGLKGLKVQDSGYVDMKVGTPPSKSDYLDMDPKKNGKKPGNNEYVDMSFKKKISSPIKASKAPQGSPNSFDYLDMNFHNSKQTTEPQEKHAPDGYVEMTLGNHRRQSSLDGTKEERRNKREKPRSQPIAIQKGTLESRKMYLPLSSPCSSLPRHASRCNSKDSSSSSVNTPSSSSTIFPISINSPCSPRNGDYLDMDRAKPTAQQQPMDTSEYMNFNPASASPVMSRVPPWRPDLSDYALMTPGRIVGMTDPLLEGVSFKPIDGEQGSRPASVNSDVIRPLEVQLHYASLDLAPSEDEGSRSPRTVGDVEGGLSYAEIDFYKSDGFKHSALPSNTRVKH